VSLSANNLKLLFVQQN